MSDDSLIFLPLGGAGEIGMNLSLYGCSGKWLMVDLGVTFGEHDLPGIDVVMPDPKFIAERKDDLVALILTHGHEDHLGAVPYLWTQLRCPIYATGFTADLLIEKLREVGLADAVELHVVNQGDRFTVGPFDIEYVTVTHSLPEPNALAIRTRFGTVLHTGDWKLDPGPLVGPVADTTRLDELGEEGVLAVIGDSTNIFVKGTTGSEAAVRESLIELFGAYHGRIAVACFASNVARLESVAVAAAAHGRSVAAFGRSLKRIERIARANGYLSSVAPFIDDREAARVRPDRLVALCTGSQGESNAALARIASGSHPSLTLGSGDVAIFSSRIIPGNEREIFNLQNMLVRKGVEVVTDKDRFIHVSGHPAREDVRRLYELVRPTLVVPVHGELRHLHEHAAFALECGVSSSVVVENGDILNLAPGAPEIVDKAFIGRLGVYGDRLVPVESDFLRQRRQMSRGGGVVVSLAFDRRGLLVAEPQIATLGLPDDPDDSTDEADLVAAVRSAIEDMAPAQRQSDESVREVARRATRRHFDRAHGFKPPTEVNLVRI
jgi:ribonuclease J